MAPKTKNEPEGAVRPMILTEEDPIPEDWMPAVEERTLNVHVVQDHRRAAMRLTFFYYEGNRRFFAKPVELHFEEIPLGQDIPPTFMFTPEAGEYLLRSIALARSSLSEEESEEDAEQESDISPLEARIEAMNDHLEDMRSLVFKGRARPKPSDE